MFFALTPTMKRRHLSDEELLLGIGKNAGSSAKRGDLRSCSRQRGLPSAAFAKRLNGICRIEVRSGQVSFVAASLTEGRFSP